MKMLSTKQKADEKKHERIVELLEYHIEFSRRC